MQASSDNRHLRVKKYFVKTKMEYVFADYNKISYFDFCNFDDVDRRLEILTGLLGVYASQYRKTNVLDWKAGHWNILLKRKRFLKKWMANKNKRP